MKWVKSRPWDGWTQLGLAVHWYNLILVMHLSAALWIVCHGCTVVWLDDEMIVTPPDEEKTDG